MPRYKYLIIGGGMAADAAVRGIREVDANGAIGLISAEPDPPYDRPPLSKGLWQGKPLEKIWRGTVDRDIALHLGRDAHTLDLQIKGVTDDGGTIYTFDKLLLATGGAPRKLPLDNESVIYFRTLEDYRQLRALTENRQRFGVIGDERFSGNQLHAFVTVGIIEEQSQIPRKGTTADGLLGEDHHDVFIIHGQGGCDLRADKPADAKA